jgi:hypothetical protein
MVDLMINTQRVRTIVAREGFLARPGQAAPLRQPDRSRIRRNSAWGASSRKRGPTLKVADLGFSVPLD